MSSAAKVVVLGLDGLEPSIVEGMLRAGELPHLARLQSRGGYARLATTVPAQTPVAWSTFATGVNPGGHGVFDFLRRNPLTYLPDAALARFEQGSPLLPPRAVNLRRGVAVWDRLSEAGIASTVLRCPGTFPPNEIRGRMLAGMGVPDLRGGFGTATFFSSADAVQRGEAEQVATLTGTGESWRSTLTGPRDASGRDLTVPFTLRVDPATHRATIAVEGGKSSMELPRGTWSPWLRVRFRTGPFASARALVRFLLLRDASPVELYASPLNFDPRHPLYPLSHPSGYAADLEDALGSPFYTTGLIEDHTGLSNGRFGEREFLAQCDLALQEREAMLTYELGRFREGLLFCLFDTPDRVQHMFWRFRERSHPANRDGRWREGYDRVIEEHMAKCDAIVGRVMDAVDERTLVIVLSDHGFCSFQRSVHLNAWLEANGFLTLHPGGADDRESAPDFFRHVDWGRTRAYALGFGGIYINTQGREGEGSVPAAEAEDVARAIARQIGGLADPGRSGAVAVQRARPRRDLYSGPYVEEAPDVVVECAPGYRVSFETALGGVPARVIDDNLRPWAGDHIVDAERVPGVLFLSRPFDDRSARMTDLAPTILRALGAPDTGGLEGTSLLS